MSKSKAEIIECLSNLPQDRLFALFKLYEAEQAKHRLTESKKDGLIFDICTIPPEIQKEVSLYEREDGNYNRKWVEAVKMMPTQTTALPKLDKSYVEYVSEVWSERISGLKEIYDKLLLHIVQYLRTGKTRPIILSGAPGCGKTRVMLTLGEMLDMPVHFANAIQMARGNGLSGSLKQYVGSGPGEPVEAMIRHKRGNLILAIDEIDKVGRDIGHRSFEDELLNMTSDESAIHHKDNFLGFTIDASHLFIIMTANDLNYISEPLKSRCDIIKVPEPTVDVIVDVMSKHTVPKLLDSLKCRENVSVDNTALSEMVTVLFHSGIRDVRKFQNIVEEIINSAYLKSLRTATCVEVSNEVFQSAIATHSYNTKKYMGFA